MPPTETPTPAPTPEALTRRFEQEIRAQDFVLIALDKQMFGIGAKKGDLSDAVYFLYWEIIPSLLAADFSRDDCSFSLFLSLNLFDVEGKECFGILVGAGDEREFSQDSSFAKLLGRLQGHKAFETSNPFPGPFECESLFLAYFDAGPKTLHLPSRPVLVFTPNYTNLDQSPEGEWVLMGVRSHEEGAWIGDLRGTPDGGGVFEGVEDLQDWNAMEFPVSFIRIPPTETAKLRRMDTDASCYILMRARTAEEIGEGIAWIEKNHPPESYLAKKG